MTNRAGSAAAAAKEAHTVISTIGRWVGEIAHEHVTVPVPNGAWRAGARNRLRALATARAPAATFAATSAATAGALAARLLRSRRRRRRSERRRRGCSVGDESRDKLLASPIGNLLGESGEGLTCGSDGVEHSRYVGEYLANISEAHGPSFVTSRATCELFGQIFLEVFSFRNCN